MPARGGSAEVVCHNDLSPKNTVYRDDGDGLSPVAFLDWDLAAPGARIDDLAHLCWRFPDLGSQVSEPVAAGERMRLVCDAYGLGDRTPLVEMILWRQYRYWRRITDGADAGNETMIRLRDGGAVEAAREAHQWVERHQITLERAVLTT